MVTLGVSEFSDAIHEQEGLAEIGKLENSPQVVIGYDLPFVNLASKGCQIARAKRRSSASARHTAPLGKARRGAMIFRGFVLVSHYFLYFC